MFMRCIVIGNQMQGFALGCLPVNLTEKFQPFGVAMTLLALPNHSAIKHIQCSEHGGAASPSFYRETPIGWSNGSDEIELLHFDRASHLLQVQNDKLCWPSWCKADQDINDATRAVIIGCCLRVALNKVGLLWTRTLEGTLVEKILHEDASIEPDLRPQGLIIGLRHGPLEATVQAFLDEQSKAADGNIFPFTRECFVSSVGSSPPVHYAIW
jgi:hypothetical protein